MTPPEFRKEIWSQKTIEWWEYSALDEFRRYV